MWDVIKEIKIGGDGNDILIWTGSKSGMMTYSSAWEHIRKKASQTIWAKELWRPIQPPRRSLLYKDTVYMRGSIFKNMENIIQTNLKRIPSTTPGSSRDLGIT
ncbi:hypothetical protein QJS10_CPB04g01804 [Acorus calamus]|uniref:Uncharacterized protein n=1 Tax=Acorus calamus TaxID=4465 RepID=A0AAV9EZA7_ACOCL|nr:hypothetical protein QJS10_CPB04g01804 [Acorus calamus]